VSGNPSLDKGFAPMISSINPQHTHNFANQNENQNLSRTSPATTGLKRLSTAHAINTISVLAELTIVVK
jgi:hypothetical protein